MKSPYDDRLTIEDIAEYRQCSIQNVRRILGTLNIKAESRLGTACIYSAVDSKRACEYAGQSGRPSVYTTAELLDEALARKGLTWASYGRVAYDEYACEEPLLLSRWPTTARKLQYCWGRRADGAQFVDKQRRPAWPAALKEEIVEFLVADLTERGL